MTLHRLLFREIVLPLLLSLVLVCQLLVVMQMLQLNDILFGSGFDPLGVLRIASYLAPHFALIALPLAFLLAVMLGLGRMNEDGELVALQALGRSPLVLYAVPAVLGVLLAFVVGVLAFKGQPWGLRGIRQQLNELIKKNVAGDIQPGVFFEDIPRFTVFVGGAQAGERWERVLLHDQGTEGAPILLLAQKGRVESEGSDSLLRLRLDDGEMHRAEATGAYTKARFEGATLALGVGNFIGQKNKFRRPAQELEMGEMPEAIRQARARGDEAGARRIESAFHARVAAPFSCLVFGLIAVPLAAVGRGARGRSFGATVLAFAGYYVVQTLGAGMGETGRLSVWAGAWLPNAVGLVVALGLGWRLVRGARAGGAR